MYRCIYTIYYICIYIYIFIFIVHTYMYTHMYIIYVYIIYICITTFTIILRTCNILFLRQDAGEHGLGSAVPVAPAAAAVAPATSAGRMKTRLAQILQSTSEDEFVSLLDRFKEEGNFTDADEMALIDAWEHLTVDPDNIKVEPESKNDSDAAALRKQHSHARYMRYWRGTQNVKRCGPDIWNRV